MSSTTSSDTFSLFNQKKMTNLSVDMVAADIQEFYYIVPIENLHFILENGILSRSRRDKFEQEGRGKTKDISDSKVQERRAKKKITYRRDSGSTSSSNLSLHRFANLYLNPHNAMMAVVAPKTSDLCVLRISREILARGDVILTSQNAATDNAAFRLSDSWRLSPTSSSYLSRLSTPTQKEFQEQKKMDEGAKLFSTNKEEFDKQYPKGARDFFQEKSKIEKPKQVRQAEALVRSKVKPRFITGIFVPDKIRQEKVKKILTESKRTDVTVTQHLSLFIGYKAEGQSKGSYQDLAPFMVPRLDEFGKKELLRWDNGYPSDLSDEEDSLSSSSASFSSSFSTPSPAKRQKKNDEEKSPSPLKLEEEGDYPLGRLPILTARREEIVRKITKLEEELHSIDIEISKENIKIFDSSSSSMSSSSSSS